MSSHSDSPDDSSSKEIKGFEFNGILYPTYIDMVSAKRQRNALFLQQKMLEISSHDDVGSAPKKKGNNCKKAASSTLSLVRRNPRRSATSSIASYHEKDGPSISSQSSASFSDKSATWAYEEGPQMSKKPKAIAGSHISRKSTRRMHKPSAIKSTSSPASSRKRKSSSYYRGTKLQDSKYRVYIFDKKKEHNLGRYMLESDAAYAYDEAAKLVKGSSWKRNFESKDVYIEARANEIKVRGIRESDTDSCDAIDLRIKARMQTVFPELVKNTEGQEYGEEQGIHIMENILDYNETTRSTDISKKRKASTKMDSNAIATNEQQSSHRLSSRKRKISSYYKGTKLQDSKYRVAIFHNKKEYNLGRYMLESDAAHAYDEAAKLLKGSSWKRNFQSRNAYLETRANEIKQRGIDEEELISSDAIGMQIKARLKIPFPELESYDVFSIDSDYPRADVEHTSDQGHREAEEANQSESYDQNNVFASGHNKASEPDCSSGRISSLHPQSIIRRKNRPAAVPRPRHPFDTPNKYFAENAVQRKRLRGPNSDNLLPILDVREMSVLLEHIVLEGLLARSRENDFREFGARGNDVDGASVRNDSYKKTTNAEDSKIYSAALNKDNTSSANHAVGMIGSDSDDELIPKEYLLSSNSLAQQEMDRVWIEEYGDGIDPRLFADEYIASNHGKDGKYTSLLVQSCWDRAVHEVSSTIPVNLDTKQQDEIDQRKKKPDGTDSEASLHNQRMAVASTLHANAMNIVNSVIDSLFSEQSSLTQILNDESRCKRIQWHDVWKLMQALVSSNDSNIPSFNEATMNAISMRLIERYGKDSSI